jgi:hypothetical protein
MTRSVENSDHQKSGRSVRLIESEFTMSWSLACNVGLKNSSDPWIDPDRVAAKIGMGRRQDCLIGRVVQRLFESRTLTMGFLRWAANAVSRACLFT